MQTPTKISKKVKSINVILKTKDNENTVKLCEISKNEARALEKYAFVIGFDNITLEYNY